MFCPNCGHDNSETAAHCAACGTSLMASAPPPPLSGYGPPAYGMAGGHLEPKPDNYLVWAIVTTLLCCLPAGIVSIIYAAQVDTKYSAGDYAGARESSEKAKWWAYASLVGWGIVVVGYLLLVAIAIISEQH